MSEVRLTLGRRRADVSPLGGRVRSYEVEGVPVLAGEESPELSLYRGSLLAPWPNRVTGGRWAWEGTEHALPVNEPSLGTALHGLVAYAPFQVVDRGSAEVLLAHDLRPSAGYPFSLRLEASYELTAGGLSCALRAVNSGDRPAPVALGVHPYLDCRGLVDEVQLALPASSRLLLSSTWEDVGVEPVAGTLWDFRSPRRLGARAVDACWGDLLRGADGRVVSTVTFPDGDEVALWGGPTSRWLVVYNGDTLPGSARRRSIAIEPCTGPPNALRSGKDLDVVAPGDSLELTWGVSTSW